MRRYLRKGYEILRGPSGRRQAGPVVVRQEPHEAAAEPAIDPVYFDTIALALKAEHINGARLFATRHDMVRELGIPERAAIAEIGVAEGNFSDYLLTTLKPATFVAFDLFDLHDSVPKLRSVFGERTHLDYYRDRLASFSEETRVEIRQGDSSIGMKALEDASVDMIYVDGDHRLAGVIKDAEASIAKLKPGGILIFNDYIMHDHIANMRYGVVEVVNDLCVNRGWRVIGLALQHDMFCDIALVRGPDAR